MSFQTISIYNNRQSILIEEKFTYIFKFLMSKEKPERDSERHHEHDEERKEERGRRRLDHPQDGEADTLANGEKMHFQGSDLKKCNMHN